VVLLLLALTLYAVVLTAAYTFFVIPFILPFYFWDKTRQERLIAASHVQWIIVHPAALTNGAQRGIYRHGRHIGSFLWTQRISRADVADFMLNQLSDSTYLRSAPGVTW
jgi:putative NAD(P)-binding protein